MHPYLIRFSEISIAAYPILYGLGITFAGILIIILGIQQGYNIKKLGNLLLVITFAILVGSRIFYVLQYHTDFENKWNQAFDFVNGGQVFYGGLLLTIPSIILYCKLSHLPIRGVFDIIAVATPLGLIVGRLGCFCRGCCYGKITNSSLAVSFPKHIDFMGNIIGSPAFIHQLNDKVIAHATLHSLPVHPTQLYSAFASLCIFIFMFWLYKKEYAKGRLLFVYLFVYAIFRFFIEFIRNNEIIFIGLTMAQIISCFFIVGCLFSKYIFVLRKKVCHEDK
ncbi:MAG: prolipoprotein diacylglyceryl transferase [Phycisphaerae bacterium]|nr:prolipoprotein diacylglyceryl transferase [Phycisphaerae bacterium]